MEASKWPVHVVTTEWAVGKPTQNGRIYPRDTTQNAITVFMNKESNKGGYLTDPKNPYADLLLETMTHVVKRVWIEPDEKISAEIRLLPTQHGQLLDAMLTSSPESFSLDLRAYGKVARENEDAPYIVTDLEITAICVYPKEPLN